MKIATWNVNSVRSRLTHIIDWLGQNPVDVLCLQETKVIDADFPLSPLQTAGYYGVFSGQKSYNGVAILSLQPLEQVTIGFAPVLGTDAVGNFDEQKRVIAGVYRGIRIINVYVPNGSAIASEKYDYKLAWLDLLKQYLQHLRGSNQSDFCIGGDFNIALEDRDIHDPTDKDNHIMSSPAERHALKNLLELGLQDAFRKFTQESGHYSWWDYRTRGFSRNRGWRIDHLYLTPGLYDQAQRCHIDATPRGWDKPSDHAPVIVDIY